MNMTNRLNVGFSGWYHFLILLLVYTAGSTQLLSQRWILGKTSLSYKSLLFGMLDIFGDLFEFTHILLLVIFRFIKRWQGGAVVIILSKRWGYLSVGDLLLLSLF